MLDTFQSWPGLVYIGTTLTSLHLGWKVFIPFEIHSSPQFSCYHNNICLSNLVFVYNNILHPVLTCRSAVWRQNSWRCRTSSGSKMRNWSNWKLLLLNQRMKNQRGLHGRRTGRRLFRDLCLPRQHQYVICESLCMSVQRQTGFYKAKCSWLFFSLVVGNGTREWVYVLGSTKFLKWFFFFSPL